MLERAVPAIWQSGIRISGNICRDTCTFAGRNISATALVNRLSLISIELLGGPVFWLAGEALPRLPRISQRYSKAKIALASVPGNGKSRSTCLASVQNR
jgi:hypothetical protein